tara:strand:+ start:351 stop:575 length:225 start_codon:yes stop_codon:yes gene_type:complete
MDVGIPELSDEEICAGICAQRPHMPVVFMGGYSSPDMLWWTEQVESALVLEKPFSLAVFRSVIMEAIGDDSSAS